MYPNFLQQISQNSPNSLILGANHAKLTKFTLISINLLFFFFKTLVRQDPAPCLHELCESRSLKLRFAKPPLLYSLHNKLTLYILLQDNSLQFETTIYQCVVTIDENELILILQNANFPNFRPTFNAQAIRISGK